MASHGQPSIDNNLAGKVPSGSHQGFQLSDYGVAEKIEETEAKITEETTFDSNDSESEKERSHKLAIAITKMDISREKNEKKRDSSGEGHRETDLRKSEPVILSKSDQIKKLSEQSTGLIMMKEFRRALTVLKEILGIEESDKLETMLKIAECEMHLQDGNAKESFQQAGTFISGSKNSSADEFLKMAINERQKNNHVRSLILLHISNDIHQKKNVSSVDTVIWIDHLGIEISNTTEFLIEEVGTSRDIGVKYSLKFMENLLKELREEKNADARIRAELEVGLLANITHILNTVGEHYKAIQFCEEAIAIAEKQLGKSVSKNGRYGVALNNLGEAYEKLERFSKAEDNYTRAINVFKKSSATSEKIEKTSARLARVREKDAEKKKNFST